VGSRAAGGAGDVEADLGNHDDRREGGGGEAAAARTASGDDGGPVVEQRHGRGRKGERQRRTHLSARDGPAGRTPEGRTTGEALPLRVFYGKDLYCVEPPKKTVLCWLAFGKFGIELKDESCISDFSVHAARSTLLRFVVLLIRRDIAQHLGRMSNFCHEVMNRVCVRHD
jgi:hypothetical protein